jgi:heavy metal efflux system protein
VLNWLIDISLRNRVVVLLATLVVIVIGLVSVRNLSVDAFPDTTPIQVQVNTIATALSPEEVERQITAPIEQQLGGLPRLESLRSISKFGLSQVVLIFEDGTDVYLIRQLVDERLRTVQLPEGMERPKMGPLSTGLGEVFHYIVIGRGSDPSDLRTIQDWVIRPAMKTVAGTAEINSWGGFEKQFQVRIDPVKLVRHGLTADEVAQAVRRNNLNVGGGIISRSSGMLLVQGQGRTITTEQIGEIAVTTRDGVPIRVRDVANVLTGHEVRRGAVTADGQGEVVLGLGFMTIGENSHTVTWAMKRQLDEMNRTLPANVRAVPVYDRTELVGFVIDTVRKNLFEGGLLVIAVLFAFLGNLRAAVIVSLAIPLSMFFAFTGMVRFGIAASLLSLGAIDFGMVVDSSVVMVENCVRRLAESGGKRCKLEVIREATLEVRKPTLFGELIIMIVYLPILTLEGVEGKLFRPMALTVIFALFGSMILSLTLMPVLASYILPKRPSEREPLLMRLAHCIHNPVLRFAMHYKLAVVGFAVALLGLAFGLIAPSLGWEFVPKLSEGAIVIAVTRIPGTSLEESVRYNTRMEQAILAAFPDEVSHTWSRVGSAEIATDPMGVELTDLFITLKPRQNWTKASNQDELTEQLSKLLRDLPGQAISFTQPIGQRIAEMSSGGRTDLILKLYGDDFPTLEATGKKIETVLKAIPGNADVAVERLTGQPILQVNLDRNQLARYGVDARTVFDLIEAIGSKHLGEVVDGPLRFPLITRLPERDRATPEAIGQIIVSTATGEQIPLARLAKVEVTDGPATVKREWGQRHISITCNIRGRDLAGFVEQAQADVSANVPLPPGRYRIEFGGQYQDLIRARTRLLIVVPIALLLIFGLLYITYGNLIDTFRVLTGVPFAWVGGIIALWLREMPLSIPAAVGFIAMSGLAVLDDMILVSAIRRFRAAGRQLDDAVTQASVTRLRPVLMTTLVASLGFLPMALSDGVGAEVQRPLATVVIGGVIGAMVMSLLVVRVLYLVGERVKGVIRIGRTPDSETDRTSKGGV